MIERAQPKGAAKKDDNRCGQESRYARDSDSEGQDGHRQYTYTVQFADQGTEAANEAEAQRELRRTLEEVLEALRPS